MDEPTDRALRIQGLNREEYDSLSEEGRSLIAGRSRRLVQVADITLAAELLKAVLENEDGGKEYVAGLFEGRHPDFEETVRKVVGEYVNSGVDTSIRDYYKIKYGGSGLIPPADAEKDAEDLLAKPEEPAATKTPTPPKPEPAAKPQAPLKPAAPKPAETSTPAGPSPAAEPQKTGDRRRDIAAILSQWEGRDVDSVMRTEADVIDSIMAVADEDRDVSDEAVCRACKALVDGESEVQFVKEALMPEHRSALLEQARTG